MNDVWMDGLVWFMFALQTFAVYYFISVFLEPRISKPVIGYMVFMVESLGARCLINYFGPSEFWLIFLITTIVYCLIITTVFRWKCLKDNTIVTISMLMIIDSCSVIGTVLAQFITNTNIILMRNMSDYEQTYLIAVPICTLLIMLCFEIVICIWKMKWKRDRNSSMKIIFFSLYQGIIVVMFYLNCRDFTPYFVLNVVLIMMFTMLIDGLLIYYFDVSWDKAERKRQLEQIEICREQEYEYYLQRQEQMERFRILRHEYINTLGVVEQMIHHGDEREACNFIDKIICVQEGTNHGTDD